MEVGRLLHARSCALICAEQLDTTCLAECTNQVIICKNLETQPWNDKEHTYNKNTIDMGHPQMMAITVRRSTTGTHRTVLSSCLSSLTMMLIELAMLPWLHWTLKFWHRTQVHQLRRNHWENHLLVSWKSLGRLVQPCQAVYGREPPNFSLIICLLRCPRTVTASASLPFWQHDFTMQARKTSLVHIAIFFHTYHYDNVIWVAMFDYILGDTRG